MHTWMDGYGKNCMKVCMCMFLYIHNVIPGSMSLNQRIHVVIDVKELIWLPNENICDCHLTLNRHMYCV